ncbi:hypothetical protein FHS11_001483 [Mucilaginibacter gotjawali]|uniref:Uncharacterized protein n=1 Tax=Mucilaginibacter gotjawali TaxID=1550579 RepID=A0A839SB50_9SPHI|nr:hypothetical protein [Mucilaginibacter gotjawali]
MDHIVFYNVIGGSLLCHKGFKKNFTLNKNLIDRFTKFNPGRLFFKALIEGFAV